MIICGPGFADDIQYVQTRYRCECGQQMHRAQGTTFLKCIACGAEGYEVPVN